MNVTAVQEERGPRKHKRRVPLLHLNNNSYRHANEQPPQFSIPILKITPALASSVPSRYTAYEALHYRILTQILMTCIKQARSNENFSQFNRNQQNSILENVWSECFILRASHWSIDIGSIIDGCVK